MEGVAKHTRLKGSGNEYYLDLSAVEGDGLTGDASSLVLGCEHHVVRWKLKWLRRLVVLGYWGCIYRVMEDYLHIYNRTPGNGPNSPHRTRRRPRRGLGWTGRARAADSLGSEPRVRWDPPQPGHRREWDHGDHGDPPRGTHGECCCFDPPVGDHPGRHGMDPAVGGH